MMGGAFSFRCRCSFEGPRENVFAFRRSRKGAKAQRKPKTIGPRMDTNELFVGLWAAQVVYIDGVAVGAGLRSGLEDHFGAAFERLGLGVSFHLMQGVRVARENLAAKRMAGRESGFGGREGLAVVGFGGYRSAIGL